MYSFGVLVFISTMISASALSLPPWTTPPTTTPPTTNAPTTIPAGCFYQGNFYPSGEIKSDPNGCYGVVCDPNGHVYYWDNFHCQTTPPTTTAAPTTPSGCYYNGKFYPPGEIERGSDGQGWCYGTYCTYDYQVIYWDDFSCGPTTTPTQTTTLPHPTTLPPPLIQEP